MQDDDHETLTLPAARPEFMSLSEASVWKAIVDDPGQGTAIAGEVTRLMVECLKIFKAHSAEGGCPPERLLRADARCPIEAVAVLLAVKYVEDEVRAAGAGKAH